MTQKSEDRFSGHESFVCRYGWLAKVHRAVVSDERILRGEMAPMQALGIGRNMVRSIQFWGESTGVIAPAEGGGYRSGPVGDRLLGADGWDPHLERTESLWLLHWWLVTRARLGAWTEVFATDRLHRFERKTLIERLALRGQDNARPLAASTLEQHASIFIQSYFQESRGMDDTSWCPLQDLGLLQAARTDDGRTVYTVSTQASTRLTTRMFAVCLVDYFKTRAQTSQTLALHEVLRAEMSPGSVFKLDESTLRQLLEDAQHGPLKRALRFTDTADTQTIFIDHKKVPQDLVLTTEEELADA